MAASLYSQIGNRSRVAVLRDGISIRKTASVCCLVPGLVRTEGSVSFPRRGSAWTGLASQISVEPTVLPE